MGGKVGIIETSLRDGQQSLWATRMTTAMMLPILPVLDRAGFEAIECQGSVIMDATVRYLRENPWERTRLIKQRVRRTPLQMMCGPVFSVGGNGIVPDDLLALYMRCCARSGIDRFFIQDGNNDIRNVEVPIRAQKAEGATVLGSVTFSASPVHTDEHFALRAQRLAQLGADAIVLKDANGVLTPERARTLIPALRQAAGGLSVYCHSHCVTGLGPASNLEAVRQGAAAIWTAAAPLANGSSLPATESMVRHLRREGYEVALDDEGIRQISQHFQGVAERHGLPTGRPAEYDPSHYDHQLPGGMISNFRAQLAALGIEDRLEEVLREIPAVRRDLGWSIMVTPFSQIIGTQAALNVLYGPYKVVPDDVRKLVLGHFGETPAPVDPNLLDRLGGGQEPVTVRPGEIIPHAVERIRAELGAFTSDEDLLLAAFFMPDVVQRMYEAGPIRTSEDSVPVNSLVDLVRQVSHGVTDFHLVAR